MPAGKASVGQETKAEQKKSPCLLFISAMRIVQVLTLFIHSPHGDHLRSYPSPFRLHILKTELTLLYNSTVIFSKTSRLSMSSHHIGNGAVGEAVQRF